MKIQTCPAIKTIISILKFSIILLLFIPTQMSAQVLTYQDTVTEKAIYPYKLPIWGQKATDRGYGDQLQLPLGVNINYVNVFIDMRITEFQLFFGDQDLSGIINTETLNFQEVSATTNGVSWRVDAWIFPFMNVYGLFSKVTGGTNVTLQPTWKDAVGDIILQLPQFSSEINFDATAYGVGTTLVFGIDNYFLSTDINYSKTSTELLDEQVGYLTLSARAGYKFNLSRKNPDMFLAPYVGMMYRNFVGAKGSNGSINMNEVFPELDNTFNMNVDDRIQENTDAISNLHPIFDAQEIIVLNARNTALSTIKTTVNDSGLFSTEIDYFIRKEMIQPTTFQFGYNFQINKHWMIRGEYGVSDSQRFLMTGLQYRFGIKRN